MHPRRVHQWKTFANFEKKDKEHQRQVELDVKAFAKQIEET